MGAPAAENAIRQIVETRCRAVADGDVDAMTAHVADDVTIFDVVVPMRSAGKAAARNRAEEWLASYDGRVSWDVQDLTIAAADDIGFCHCISRVRGTLRTGAAIDMWFRTTLGLRRIDGAWRIVHDHSSDPFDPETGMASMEKPAQL